MQAEITTTQVFLAAVLPTLSLSAWLVVNVIGFADNNRRFQKLACRFDNGFDRGTEAQLTGLKSDINSLIDRVDVTIATVNSLIKRFARIEDKLGIRP